MATKPIVDKRAAEHGLEASQGFVEVIDMMEGMNSENFLILQIRNDGAIESYCSLKRTDMVVAPVEYVMMASLETCLRQEAASRGVEFPTSGTEEWAEVIANRLIHLARRFVDSRD